jgi:hypothetical protein
MEEFPLCVLRISVGDMIALGVRNKSVDSPELLYQQLPMKGLTLMATIPQGLFAVSIPQGSDPNEGFSITRESPLPEQGFVIVYARKPNNCYEAVAVRYCNEEFNIEEFPGIARRWVSDNLGGIEPIHGRYACFTLNKEEWGGVLRDNGYVAGNPHLSAKTSALLSSTIPIRIPVYKGNKKSQEEIFPVFSQVEVAMDFSAGSPRDWISFAVYQDFRNTRSILPTAVVPDLTEWLASLAKESGLESWIFRPGMLFGDSIEWWGGCNQRSTVHEGIDFAEGLHPVEGRSFVAEGTPVRSIMDGQVVAILDDFIGKTVVMRHSAIKQLQGDVFHTFLSHIQPTIEKMGQIAKGEILGKVGKPASAKVSAHLHLTCAWIPDGIRIQGIGLDVIHPGFAPVVLIDLNKVVGGRLGDY